MPNLNILIKPASGNCNMRCKYCFYADEINKRSDIAQGSMTLHTAEKLIKEALLYVGNGECTFGFQGGEPTLRGIDFFRSFVDLVAYYNKNSASIRYCLQTNGLLINKEWTTLFKNNNFLIGLSIDGPAIIHNENRIDAEEKSTFNRVLQTARLLEKEKVQFNVLTVVTAKTSRYIDSIYNFFIKNGLLYQQYIPCLDPIFEARGGKRYSLLPEQYGDFLIKLFDRWYADRINGKFIYIHYFESLAGMMKGCPPSSCGMSGMCSSQNVVEADGSVFPCDFYCLDEYKIGNINEKSFEELDKSRVPFIVQSFEGLKECASCKYGKICRGGCRRDRQTASGLDKNYFCSSYKRFFEHALPKMIKLLSDR